jgi:hypothetical protein
MMRRVRVLLSDDFLEVRLSAWEKALGLVGDLRVARTNISDVQLVADPMRAAMSFSAKVGMRIPWYYYVAHTIRFDEVLIVRRGEPGLSFSVRGRRRLRRVLVSAPDAGALVGRLTGAERS